MLCGDSQDEEHLARLINGATPDLLHTDPPYGINIVRLAKGRVGGRIGSGGRWRGAQTRNRIIAKSNLYPPVHGDDQAFDPRPLLSLAPIAVLWGANYFCDKLPISARWFCWDKREGITRNSFADCELAWCSESGAARVFHHLWNGLHKGSQHDEPRSHPTEKPIALFREIGELLAPAGLWLDTYAGTGAQLLAAEASGATCYASEI